MSLPTSPQPRSLAIVKSWSTLDWASVFSAIIYPLLGLVIAAACVMIALFSDAVALDWRHALAAVLVGAGTLFLCNQGIGGLHRIWQHRAGELAWPAQVFVAINCILAMQGKVKDWVNYHSLHHRLSDQPGDPHNPAESKFWAWIGWILWRDPLDLQRPLASWLKENPVAQSFDKRMMTWSLAIHLFAPAAAYVIVGLAGGSLVTVALLHAAAVIGRGIQFHATTLGVNVLGHMKTPKWVDYTIALLTGGEGLHDHHHEFPASALHLPRKGFVNRLVDYNGTVILLFERLKWAKHIRIAPQFA